MRVCYVWLQLLCSCLWILCTITTSAAGGSQNASTPYLILMAKTLYQQSLHYIMPVYNDAHAGPYAVQVDSINPFNSRQVKKGQRTHDNNIIYRIPFKSYDEENIRLNFTIFAGSREVATDTRVLPVIADPSVNIIQISQSRFHPNETVYFRVISYVSNTVALLHGRPIDKVYIEDAASQRLKQWDNVPLLKAFEGYNFTLPQKAALGKWRVNLVIDQIVDYEEFHVDDNPRPMFTVKLRQPKYLRLDAKYFTFNVCAEYPYIESMEAEINATFCIVETHFINFFQAKEKKCGCTTIMQGLSDIKGCIAFNKTTASLNLDPLLSRFHPTRPSLKSVLTVEVKQLNGHSVHETAIGDVGNQQMDLNIEGADFYKPGLPYRGSVSVKHMDGQPASGASVLILAPEIGVLNGTHKRTDQQGSFQFGFPSMPGHTKPVHMKFEVVRDSKLSRDSRMMIPSVEKTLKPASSKTGAFIQIELDESACSSKISTIPFKLRSNVEIVKENIRAAVISERNFTSYFPFTNTPMPEVCEDTDDPIFGHYRCVKGQQIKCLDGWHGDNCLTPTNRKGGSTRKPLEKLTIYLRKGTLDVTETWHRRTQMVIWTMVKKNNITDVISDTASFKKADKCSPPLEPPRVTLDKKIVEQNSSLTLSMAGVNSKEMVCSLSVIRDCKIGCSGDINSIDSHEKLNALVDEFITWCHGPPSKYITDNSLMRDFNNAGFIVATNFPIDRNSASRVRRSAVFRKKRSTQSSVNKPPSLKRAVIGTWNHTMFNGPRKELKLTAPTSPGKWKALIMCLSPGGIRISPAAKFTVEKPLHLATSLPMSFKVGKKYSIPISLLYTRNVCSNVKFKATVSNGTRIIGKPDVDYRFCKHKHKVFKIEVEPLGEGTVIIQLEAITKSFTDRIQHEITIEPQGKTENNTVEYVSCEDEGSGRKSQLNKPKVSGKIVDGSRKISVMLSGNVIGKKINNLNGLIRAPNGHSETNMGILSVNLNLLDYYNATGYSNQKIIRKIKKYVREGYLRQLRYRRSDGSFAPDKTVNITSTWLTTLVFAVFCKAESLGAVSVDPKVLQSALSFILSRQNNESGCFEERGFINHFTLGGGFHRRQRDKKLLTAFVLSHLKTVMDSGRYKEKLKRPLRIAFRCLSREADRPILLNTHSLTVVARALGQFNSSHPLTRRTLIELSRRENVTQEERFWLTQNRHKWFWNKRLASDVETTAHASLAKLWYKKRAALEEVVPVMRWLVRRRNVYMWYTFLDQAEALAALSRFAIVSDANGLFDPHIQVKGFNGGKEEFSVRQTLSKPQRNLVTQSIHAKEVTKLQFNRVGRGCVLIMIHRYYNVV